MIKWGILGCGGIANTFARAVNEAVPSGSLVAAAARSGERALAFAKSHGIEKHYGSYEELVADPDVDAIYVATPHSHHREHAMLALSHGKHVLCEKALAINSREVAEMFSLAKEKKLFLMEAMWMRFLPSMRYLCDFLEKGELGRIKSVSVDFSFEGNKDPERRLLNPELAGGALLDVGIYPLNFAMMVLGEDPERVVGDAYIGPTQVDESNSFTLTYGGGVQASCTSSVVKLGSKSAHIELENGVIDIPEFWRAQKLIVTKDGGKTVDELDMPFDSNGFEYEVRSAIKAIECGKLESDIMPADLSKKVMKIMDQLREQWDLVYPMERSLEKSS